MCCRWGGEGGRLNRSCQFYTFKPLLGVMIIVIINMYLTMSTTYKMVIQNRSLQKVETDILEHVQEYYVILIGQKEKRIKRLALVVRC